MNRKMLLAVTAGAIGLAFSGPAFADDHGSSTTTTTTTATDNSFHSSIGNISLSFTPNVSKTVTVTKAIADQTLNATNTNSNMDRVVDIDKGYSSGSNSVNQSAFAAFAGILNQGWNTGINANTQAANNVAVVGTTTFHN